jgi:hypothetical protein
VKDFVAVGNVSFYVNNVMKRAEEKFSFVSVEKWAARCRQVKKIEEECLKLEPATDRMSDQFIINLETDSDNCSSDTESHSHPAMEK